MWSTYLYDTILRCKREPSIPLNIAIRKRWQQVEPKLQFTSFSVIRILILGIAASSLCILGISFRKQKKGMCDPFNFSTRNSESFHGKCRGPRDLKLLENSDLGEAKRILWYHWIVVFCSSAVVIFEVASYMKSFDDIPSVERAAAYLKKRLRFCNEVAKLNVAFHRYISSNEYTQSVGRTAAYVKELLRFGNNVDKLNVALHRYIYSNEYIQSVGRTTAYVKELLRFSKTVNESNAIPPSIQPQSLSTEDDSEGETEFDEYGPSIRRTKNSNDTYPSFYDSNHESEVDKYHGCAISLQSDLCNLEPDERSENDRSNQMSELSARVAKNNENSQVGASSTQHPQHVGHTNPMDLCQSPKETEDKSGLLPFSSKSKTIGDNDTQSQGWLWIKPPKPEDPSVKRTWQKVWVKLVTSSFLKGCCLEMYSDDSETKKLKIIDLHRCAVYCDKEEKYKHYGKYVFDILKISGKEKESLMAPSEEKRTEWIDAIGRATLRIDMGGWLWWKPRKSDQPSVAYTWQKAWVHLVASSKPANCYILVYRDDTEDDLLSSIELHGCAVYHDEKERYKQNGKFMFDIINIHQGSQSLMTSTEVERSEWVDAIECIAKLGGNI